MLTTKQIKHIIQSIKQDKRIQGVLLAGSYVYGTPIEESDLDLRMITNDNSNWVMRNEEMFGTLIEAFYNSPAMIRYYFEQDRQTGIGSSLHFWANGKIMYDPKGAADSLQKEAQTLWELGPYRGQWKEYKK